MRHVDLEPIGAVIELLTRCLASFHGTIDNLNSLGHDDLGRVPSKVITAGGRDPARHNEQTRTGDVALFNRHLDADIAIASALGFDIAQSRKALLQRPTRGY